MKRLCKQYRWMAFVAFAVLLTSCATVGIVNWAEEDPGPVPNYETAKVQAVDAVKYRLKDPESAKFRNFTPFFKMFYSYGLTGGDEPLWTLCVQVNSRNSFGGYTGYDWFVVKFRDGKPVQDKNGLFEPPHPDYCIEAPTDPSRRAPG